MTKEEKPVDTRKIPQRKKKSKKEPTILICHTHTPTDRIESWICKNFFFFLIFVSSYSTIVIIIINLYDIHCFVLHSNYICVWFQIQSIFYYYNLIFNNLKSSFIFHYVEHFKWKTKLKWKLSSPVVVFCHTTMTATTRHHQKKKKKITTTTTNVILHTKNDGVCGKKNIFQTNESHSKNDNRIEWNNNFHWNGNFDRKINKHNNQIKSRIEPPRIQRPINKQTEKKSKFESYPKRGQQQQQQPSIIKKRELQVLFLHTD